MTSAESRLAAASKEIRVRVESSKNRLTTVRPRSAGSFLIGRSASERSSSAVLRISSASSRVRSAALSRWRFTRYTSCDDAVLARAGSDARDRHRVGGVELREPHLDRLDQRGREVLADEVRADRQLAVAAVDEHREPDRLRAAEVVHRVERGPDRAAGEQHVVDQDDDLAVDAARGDLGAAAACGPGASGGRRGTSSRRASRRAPTTPSTASILAAIRWASGTPRDGMPSSTRSAAPLLRSRISCAMRVRARETSRVSITTRSWSRVLSGTGAAPVGPGAGAADGAGTISRTSFSASRDGSLKDVDRRRRYQPRTPRRAPAGPS